MAPGVIVGKVAVKVWPDLRTFRTDLQKDLEKIERRMEMKLRVVPDITGLKRKLLESIRDLNAENARLESRKLKLQTRPEFDRKALASVQREYEALSRLSPIRLSTKLEIGTLGQQRLPSASIKVILKLDNDNLKKVKEAIERWRSGIDPVTITVRLDLSQAQASLVSAGLSILTRPRTVNIKPKLDHKATAAVGTALAALSGARVLSNYIKNLNNGLKNLDKNVPKIGAVSLALVQLTSFAGAALSNVLALAYSLGSIAPAALALPGILGGIAIGITASVIAFKDFAKVFPDFKKKWEETKRIVSDNFWAEAKLPFRELIDDLLPRFNAGLKGTGSALGGFFGALATALNQKLGPALNGMFRDLNKSIDIFKGHTGSIAGIITTLGNVGSSRLPQLARWMGKILDQFDAFLRKADEDGRLQQWIDTGIQALKDLGSIMKSVFDIFAGLGRAAAAAGGSTLAVLAESLREFAKIINSPEVQRGLIAFFKAAHEGMRLLFETAGPGLKALFGALGKLSTTILPLVGRTVGQVMGGIGQALSDPKVMAGITDLFKGLRKGLVAILPALPPLARAVGSLGSLIGTLAANLGPVIAAAIIPLAKAFTSLVPVIQPIITLLGTSLVSIIKTLAPFVGQLATAVGGFLTAGFVALGEIMPTLLSAFSLFVDTVGPAIIGIFKKLTPAIGPLIKILGGSLARVINALGPLIAKLAPVLGDVFVAYWEALGKVLPLVADLLVQVAKTLGDLAPVLGEVFTGLIGAVATILTGLLPFVTELVRVLGPVFTLALTTLLPLLQPLGQAFADIFVALTPLLPALSDLILAILPLLAPIVSLIIALLPVVVQLFKDWVPEIERFILKLEDLLRFLGPKLGGSIEEATPIITSFLLSMGGVVTKLLTTFNDVLDLVDDLLHGRWSEAWDNIVSIANRTLDILCNNVLAWVVTNTPRIVDVFVNLGLAIANGLAEGIGKGTFKSVKDLAAGSLLGVIDRSVGWIDNQYRTKLGINSPAKLMIPIGSSVTEGVAVGMTKGHPFLSKSVASVKKFLSSADFSIPTVGQVGGAQRAGSLGAFGGGNAAGTVINKTLVYNAAPGNGLGSEDDLFAAAGRTRMVGF